MRVFLYLLMYILKPQLSVGKECMWQLNIGSNSSFSLHPGTVQDTHPLEDVTEIVKSADLQSLEENMGDEEFYLYPYYLLLQADCDEEVDSRMVRSYTLSGGCPVVTLQYTPAAGGGQQLGTIIKTLQSSLVDARELAGLEDGCQGILCDLGWFVPLPVDGSSSLIEVMVQTVGVTNTFPKTQKLTIHVDGYHTADSGLSEDLGSSVGLADVAYNTSALTAMEVISIPHYSTMLTAGGLGAPNAFLVSQDEFEQFTVLQNPVLDGEENPVVCDCVLDTQLLAASLPDRLLFINSRGVWEVLGNFTTMDGQIPNDPQAQLIYRRCVQKVAIPPDGATHHAWEVLLMGACQHSGDVYAAELSYRSGGQLSFREVLDTDNHTLCDNLPSTQQCHLVSITNSAAVLRTKLVLVYVKFQNGTDGYLMVQHKDDNWNILSHLASEVPVNFPDEPQLLSDSGWSQLEGDNTSLVLLGLSVPHQVSSQVFLWGNRLLHSPDGGQSIYLLPDFQPGDAKITKFASSSKGTYSFLTSAQELWVGSLGSSHVKMIYPSAAWDIVAATHPGVREWHSNTTILTMFYSSMDQLHLLVSYADDGSPNMSRYEVFVDDILMQMATDVALTSPSDTTEQFLHSTTRCPFSQVLFEMVDLATYTGEQEVVLKPPQSVQVPVLADHLARTVYGAIVQHLDERHLAESIPTYADPYHNHMDRWRDALDDKQVYHSYLFHNQLVEEGLRLDLTDYQKIYQIGETTTLSLPETIYLGSNESFTFYVHITRQLSEADDGVYSVSTEDMDQLQMSVLTSDTVNLRVTTHRWMFILNASALYQVQLYDAGSLGIQEKPGMALVPVSLQLQVHHAPLNCFRREESSTAITQTGLYHMDVLLGCPPTRRVMFDHQAAKDKLASVLEKPYDCVHPDPKLPCFYFSNGFYPFFTIFDTSTGTWTPFTGRYKLKVVGGSADGVTQITTFSDDDVYAFNNQKSEGATLAWGPVDSSVTDPDGWPVYSYTQNGISWLCQPGSPCPNIKPNFPLAPDYYFLVEFSNRDVDRGNTYCDYTMQFVVHVHGLPIDAINMALMLVIASISGVCLAIVANFICCRSDARLYKSFKKLFKRPPKKVKPATPSTPPVSEEDLYELDDISLPKEDTEIDPEYVTHLAKKDWKLALQLRMGMISQSDLGDADLGDFDIGLGQVSEVDEDKINDDDIFEWEVDLVPPPGDQSVNLLQPLDGGATGTKPRRRRVSGTRGDVEIEPSGTLGSWKPTPLSGMGTPLHELSIDEEEDASESQHNADSGQAERRLGGVAKKAGGPTQLKPMMESIDEDTTAKPERTSHPGLMPVPPGGAVGFSRRRLSGWAGDVMMRPAVLGSWKPKKMDEAVKERSSAEDACLDTETNETQGQQSLKFTAAPDKSKMPPTKPDSKSQSQPAAQTSMAGSAVGKQGTLLSGTAQTKATGTLGKMATQGPRGAAAPSASTAETGKRSTEEQSSKQAQSLNQPDSRSTSKPGPPSSLPQSTSTSEPQAAAVTGQAALIGLKQLPPSPTTPSSQGGERKPLPAVQQPGPKPPQTSTPQPKAGTSQTSETRQTGKPPQGQESKPTMEPTEKAIGSKKQTPSSIHPKSMSMSVPYAQSLSQPKQQASVRVSSAREIPHAAMPIPPSDSSSLAPSGGTSQQQSADLQEASTTTASRNVQSPPKARSKLPEVTTTGPKQPSPVVVAGTQPLRLPETMSTPPPAGKSSLPQHKVPQLPQVSTPPSPLSPSPAGQQGKPIQLPQVPPPSPSSSSAPSSVPPQSSPTQRTMPAVQTRPPEKSTKPPQADSVKLPQL